MALFLSKYENKVDGKGRVSVPATFRMSAQKSGFDGVVLFQSPSFPCLEGADLPFLERIAETLASDHGPFDEVALQDGGVDIFAAARELSFDPNGRIVLPRDLRDLAGIKDQAVFVGQGAKFQVWSKEVFEAERAASLASGLKRATTIRSASSGSLSSSKGGARD